jgi:von Willebrand factor type A domain
LATVILIQNNAYSFNKWETEAPQEQTFGNSSSPQPTKAAPTKAEKADKMGATAPVAADKKRKETAAQPAAATIAAKPAPMMYLPSAPVSKPAAAPKRAQITPIIKPPLTAAPTPAPATTSTTRLTKAGKMTAGEVNDLQKWDLWSDYTQAEFAEAQRQVDCRLTRRFSVQVSHDNGAPATNQKVELYRADQPDLIVGHAVTDNTGKAELWGDPFDLTEAQHKYLVALDGQQPVAAKPFQQGINHLKSDKPCDVPTDIDIMFVVDATGSMADEIEYLKHEIEDISTKALGRKDANVRIACIFYRDHGSEYITRRFDFSKDVNAIFNFVNAQGVQGGTNWPEAVYEALQEGVDSMSWSPNARARIMFFIGDAPPHADKYRGTCLFMEKAASKGIRIVPVVCSSSGMPQNFILPNEFVFRLAALATNGTYLAVTDDSGIGDHHEAPITDELPIEKLNAAILRIINQYSYAVACDQQVKPDDPEQTLEQSRLSAKNPNNLKATPNPTKGNLKLSFDKGITELYLCDFSGKILEKIAVDGREKKTSFDCSQFPSAVYIIRYIDQDLQSGAIQIVVQH